MKTLSLPASRGNARASRALLLCLLLASSSALAWKPLTHVYLAEEARADLISRNGSVHIPEVGFLNRSIVGSIGTFQVSPQVYQALRDYPAYYRAGVLGPDAYPDFLFGQGVIHPDENDPDVSSLPTTANGTDAWFQHLHSQVQTPQQRAFYLGFLAHGAGDMFGHTFVNHYSGGPFDLFDLGNVARHMAVEGYVGNHTPPLRSGAYAIDTSAINGFIYDTLIDARRPRNGQLGNPSLPADQKARIRIWQLTRGTAGKNPVGIFTRLRAGLEDQVDGFYAHAQYLRQQWRAAADLCSWRRPGQCIKAAYYRVLLAAHQFIGNIAVHYIEAWIRDINRGLRAWPATSTDVARALFMDPTGMDLHAAGNVLTTYRNTYLCSMMGAPDAFCSVINSFANLIQQITNSFDFLREMKDAIFEWLVKKTTQRTPAQWKDLALAATLDPLMGSGTNAQINSQMGLSSSSANFVVDQFPAAYNTVTGVKLSFLDTRQQWQSVLANVGWTPSNPGFLMDQAGFDGQLFHNHVANLDGSNQWYEKRFPHAGKSSSAPYDYRKMVLAYDCALFGRFFMQQTGDLWDPAHSQQWPGVPASCPELNRLQPVSPQLQCGGFDIEVGLNQNVGPIGGVVKLEGWFSAGAQVPGSPRHAYLAPWTSATNVRFSQGLQNVSSGATVQGTRVYSRAYTTSTQVSTCGGGQTCTNFVCSGGTTLPPRLAMTWRVMQQSNGNVLVGYDNQTNAYTGDTSTSNALPVLCLRQDGRPVPPGISVDFYNGGAAGEVRLTGPVAGVTLTSRATADTLCAQQFGAGFRMGEFHDGGGGWRWWASGTLSTSTRFWVAIDDQPANPWNP